MATMELIEKNRTLLQTSKILVEISKISYRKRSSKLHFQFKHFRLFNQRLNAIVIDHLGRRLEASEKGIVDTLVNKEEN